MYSCIILSIQTARSHPITISKLPLHNTRRNTTIHRYPNILLTRINTRTNIPQVLYRLPAQPICTIQFTVTKTKIQTPHLNTMHQLICQRPITLKILLIKSSLTFFKALVIPILTGRRPIKSTRTLIVALHYIALACSLLSQHTLSRFHIPTRHSISISRITSRNTIITLLKPSHTIFTIKSLLLFRTFTNFALRRQVVRTAGKATSLFRPLGRQYEDRAALTNSLSFYCF